MEDMILQTKRLWLRKLTLEDFNDVAKMLKDERVMYAYNGAFSDKETMAWIERQISRYEKDDFGLWAMVLKESGEMIGQCGITMQPYGNRQVEEVGYLLSYRYWHSGYATEAAIACKEFGFGELGLDSLYSIIRDSNLASQRVAIRNGMNPIDRIVKHYRGVDMPHIVFKVENLAR